MKFRYKYYGKTKYGERIVRPVIPITVMSGDKAVKYEVLVDSGADQCIFHSEVASALGINLKERFSRSRRRTRSKLYTPSTNRGWGVEL